MEDSACFDIITRSSLPTTLPGPTFMVSNPEDTGCSEWPEIGPTPWDSTGTTPITVAEDADPPCQSTNNSDDGDFPRGSMTADSMAADGPISSKGKGTEEAEEEEDIDANSEQEIREGEQEIREENIGYHQQEYVRSLAATFGPNVSSQGSIEGFDSACLEPFDTKVKKIYGPLWKGRPTKDDLDTALWNLKLCKEEAPSLSITEAEGTIPATVDASRTNPNDDWLR
ncbi:hypothetical protein BCR39DRAFT_530113 [Naematelia encephala]|uniref:Uncharacterized protein n=1 Tax=Naematelia encephala TaxID=71784 RepID=A0A1Y2B5W6_9TREE|nr:hypothetical protein BCR39DRAFT_530113 [Naematelia encephala]